MAKVAKIEKWKRPAKFKVQAHSRCFLCGRPRAIYRMFGLCRICLRQRSLKGELPGMRKSSW
jgi:small subunit ribosomal protein S14